jgi:hypothetical protein
LETVISPLSPRVSPPSPQVSPSSLLTFRFSRNLCTEDDTQLGPEAKRLINEIREDAKRIKEMTAQREKEREQEEKEYQEKRKRQEERRRKKELNARPLCTTRTS